MFFVCTLFLPGCAGGLQERNHRAFSVCTPDGGHVRQLGLGQDGQRHYRCDIDPLLWSVVVVILCCKESKRKRLRFVKSQLLSVLDLAVVKTMNVEKDSIL